MNKFKNDDGITETHFKTETTAYCPIGKDYYRADIEVWVYGQKNTVDYLSIRDFCVNQLNGKNLSHEALNRVVFDKLFSEYEPEKLKVAVTTNGILSDCTTVKEM